MQQQQPIVVPVPPEAPKKKDRTVLIIVVAVLGMVLMAVAPVIIYFMFVAMVGGGFLGFMFFFQPGKVHVVCPIDRTLQVRVDDENIVSLDPGEFEHFKLDRGDHVLVITDPSRGTSVRQELEVGSGFFDMVSPAADDQCFVRVDVTDVEYPLYRARDAEPPMPIIVEYYDQREPFKMPTNSYLGESDLPASLGDQGAAYLLLDIECHKLDLSDSEILYDLGY